MEDSVVHSVLSIVFLIDDDVVWRVSNVAYHGMTITGVVSHTVLVVLVLVSPLFCHTLLANIHTQHPG